MRSGFRLLVLLACASLMPARAFAQASIAGTV